MIRVKEGELDMLSPLFDRYHQRLYGFFYRLTSRPDISADLVQDVFERVLKYRHTYSRDGRFATWLFQISRNLYHDHCRKMKRQPEGFSMDRDSFYEQPGQNNASETASVKDDQLLLTQALDQLSEDKRQALILSRIEGFRYSEIADIMNCSEGAVKVRIFRSLKELKDIITRLQETGTRKTEKPQNSSN